MADQRGVRRLRLAFVQQSLQPAGWTIQEERFDSVRHSTFLPQRAQRTRREWMGSAYTGKGRGLVMRTGLLCVLLLLLISSAGARDCSTSKEFVVRHSQRLSGIFVDPNGADLPGIGVRLLSGRKIIQDIKTDSHGRYDFGEIPTGKYQIQIQYLDRSFCAPHIQCDSKGCEIDRSLALNPKNTVIIR
jgi:hypothetical protein